MIRAARMPRMMKRMRWPFFPPVDVGSAGFGAVSAWAGFSVPAGDAAAVGVGADAGVSVAGSGSSLHRLEGHRLEPEGLCEDASVLFRHEIYIALEGAPQSSESGEFDVLPFLQSDFELLQECLQLGCGRLSVHPRTGSVVPCHEVSRGPFVSLERDTLRRRVDGLAVLGKICRHGLRLEISHPWQRNAVIIND